jgi:hypothetical protein
MRYAMLLSTMLSMFVAGSAYAEQISCTATLPIQNPIVATVDTDTLFMTVTRANGFRTAGYATVRENREVTDYFLPFSYTNSYLLQLELVGQERRALCLTDSECYLCR